MASRKIARDIFTNVLLRFYNNESCHNYAKAEGWTMAACSTKGDGVGCSLQSRPAFPELGKISIRRPSGTEFLMKWNDYSAPRCGVIVAHPFDALAEARAKTASH